MCHEKNCFITLTYDDENLPPGGTLVVQDYQAFVKRLRARISPQKLRYYFVGEYGDPKNTERPHYHAAIFGIGDEDGDLIQDCWKKGLTRTSDRDWETK